jgi:hypothetical protein
MQKGKLAIIEGVEEFFSVNGLQLVVRSAKPTRGMPSPPRSLVPFTFAGLTWRFSIH